MNATQLEYFAAAIRKYFDRMFQRNLDFFFNYVRLRWCVDRLLARGEGLAHSFDALVSNVIERAIPGGLKQIRMGRAFVGEGLLAPPQLQHHVLYNLFGHGT